jgi:hypothetical protein
MALVTGHRKYQENVQDWTPKTAEVSTSSMLALAPVQRAARARVMEPRGWDDGHTAARRKR